MKHCHYISQINTARTIKTEIAKWQFKIVDDPIGLIIYLIAIFNYRLIGSRKMIFNLITQ